MTAYRKTRPRSPRPRSEPPLTTLFDADLLTRLRSWDGVTVSARLSADDLAAGRFPPMAPGNVLELTPALSLEAFGPVPDHSEYFSDCDPVGDWWGDA